MSTEVKENLFTKEAGTLKGYNVETEAHNMYYEKSSNSEAVEKTFVLAHGASSSGRHMNLIAVEILNSIPNSKVIVVDLPFHGYSVAKEDIKGSTIHDYKRHTKYFMIALKSRGELEGTVNWIGWSMGGSIGLLLDIEDGLIDELTLVNSAPYWESIAGILTLPPFQDASLAKGAFEGVVMSELGEEPEEFVKVFTESYDAITPSGKIIINDFNAITPDVFDLREELVNVEAKTLIFSGSSDEVAEVRFQQMMHENIPNNDLVLIDAAHCPVLREDKVAELVQSIKKFF